MKFKNVAAVFFAVVLVLVGTITASASVATTTQTDSIELRTQSALLIDRSGSMEDQAAVEAALAKIDESAFDVVLYFDHRISTDSNFAGGGNSSICEVIDELADAGFDHITVVTDGEQWPADYSSLGIYTDIDLTIHLVEESKASAEFVKQLQSRLTNSSLKVVKPDGTEEIVLADYQPPIYEVEIEVPELPVIPEVSEEPEESAEPEESETVSNDDTVVVHNHIEGCPHLWLCILGFILGLLALLLALLSLFTRGEKEKDTTSASTPKPMPAKAVVQIAQGAHVVADFSGSMAAQQSETAKACMDAQKGSEAVICFGDTVSEHTASELGSIQAGGQTPGWEAIEQAYSKGWDEIVLVSDLEFNGKAFEQNAFARKFKKITVVTPSSYDSVTLEDLKKIADEVEVLPLQ